MSGRTKEEKDRIKAQQQNKAAKRKTQKQKQKQKKTEGKKALGLALPKAGETLPTLSKRDQKTALDKMTDRQKERQKQQQKQKVNDNVRYNPLVKAPIRMQKDTSPEIDNLAEATVRKAAQGFESALVGYSDRNNMKRAENILTGEYTKRFQPGVRTGMRMKVDDPALVAKAEAEAKAAGYKDRNAYEKKKAEELIYANQDFYDRKAVLDKRIELENYQGIKKYIPELAEQIGSLVPTMAVGAVSGGIGSAAGLSGAALWAFNTLMTGGEIAGRVSGQEAKQVYDYLKAQNGNAMNRERMTEAIKTANTTGELVGLAEAGTEALFGGLPFIGKGILDTAAKKVGWEVLSPATKESIKAWRNTTTGRILTAVAERTGGALGEGVEEAVMTLAQPAIESKVAGMESEVTLNDIIHDFGMGAAVSLVLGVPVTIAETTSALANAKSEKDAKNEILAAFTERNNELVAEGKMTPEQAKATVQEVQNVLDGRGSLRVSDVNRESKTESDTKEVYATVQDAKAALEEQAKGKQIGEEVSVAVVENGVPETWTARVTESGIEQMQLGATTAEDRQAYTDKAQRMANAKTPTERSGIQHNVKEEIVQEVLELSNVLGKEVEFFSAKANVHGYVENGKIYVNANSSQSPAAAVIAHEMTHLLEGTEAYTSLQGMMQKFYKASFAEKKAEIMDNYAAAGKTLTDEQADYEVMAMFVEEKLLTDYDSIRQITTADKSLAQKIVDWLNKVIRKITGGKEQRFLIEARDMWSRALQENKKALLDGAEKRYSFGGEKSETADLQALEDKIAELQKQDSQLNTRLDEYRNAHEHQKMMNAIGVLEDAELDKAVEEYKEWYTSSGYEALYNEEQELYEKLRGMRIELEEAKKEKAKNDKENYRSLYNEEFNKKYATKAARHFGTTYRFAYAGYLTVNGSLLDFSAGQRYRVRDHREISEVLDFLPEDHGYSDALIEFMNMGNIRMQSYGIDISVAPNAKQKPILRKFFDSLFGEVTVDFSRENGDSAGSVDYPEGTRSERIIRDIDNYFKTGVVPEISETQRYRFSIGRSEDAAHMEAVERGDMETAQKMVDEAAKAAGYDSPKLYHGTEQFGFTRLRTTGIEDAYNWSPFFATNDEKVAESYSGRTDRRQIKDRSSWDLNNITFDDVIVYAKEYIDPNTRLATPQDIEKLRKPLIDEVERWAAQLDAEYADKNVASDKLALMNEAKENLRKMVNATTEEEAENARSDFYDNSLNIMYGRNDSIFEDNLYFNYPPVRFEDVSMLFDKELLVFDIGTRVSHIKADQIRKKIKETGGKGIYSLYANTSEMYEIDAEGAMWNEIPGWFIGKDGLTDTRGVALYARDLGLYDGVIIRNLIDYGAPSLYMYKNPADIYIFFEPHSQVKSADPVTYDDDGNIIPLSQRFNEESDDIRWSVGKAENTDDPVRMLGKTMSIGDFSYLLSGLGVDTGYYGVYAYFEYKGYLWSPHRGRYLKSDYSKDDFNVVLEGYSQKDLKIKPAGQERYLRDAGREDLIHWVGKTKQKEARYYTVGSVVELDGQRGTVSERKTQGRSVSYVIALDNGETRKNVKPEELTVAVTPDLYFDELPEYQQNAWQEPPKGWDVSRDLADVAPVSIDMKEYREILYENGITVGVRKLNDWFKRNGWLKKIDRHYFPTEKALKEGYFQRERYGNKITAEGQRYFLDLFTRNADAFIDPEDSNDLVLPGNNPAKDSPTEERDYLEMLYEYENEIVDTGQDYSWAEALTGKGVTYSKDYARNFDAAAKHNPTLRNHLQQLFVRPLETAKADYAKAVRSRLTEMHDKMRELGIKKDTKASQAVQWIGEGFYQDKFGETHEYTIEMLKEEFPETWENIRDAATYFRHLYDEYLGEINAARELIYPHPLEDAQDQVAAYMLRRDRATDKIIELRATISELEIVIAAKKAEYDGADAELQRSIRYNEDRLNKAKISLGDYISRRSKYIEKIKQIQADIDSGDILRNKRIVPRKDYFHHFQEMSDSLGDVFALSRNSAEIDPRLEGTSGYTEPKSKFSGITLRRNHGRYKADAVEGFVRYAQVAEYMKHIDPVISQFRSHIAGMANATKDSRNANKLIRWLVQWTNDLAGKTNPADRFLQDVIGREAVQFARKINSRAKANAVVGNLNSATAQIFNLPNLVGHVKDPKAYVEGFADLCKFIVREKGTRDLVKESGFLNERYLDDVITSFDERAIKKPEKVAAWTLTVGDRYSTALIWFVAHHEAVNKGIVNPVEYADDITRRCVAGRGIGEIPITQKSNITQIFAPFQIEVNNAWQLYKEKIAGVKTANTKQEKAVSFMQFLAIIIANFILNTVTDLLIHRRVTFDPIYVLFQCIADWMSEDEEEETNWAERFVELMGRESGEIISNMPYGSLIAYYAFNNQWARENLFGDQDPTRFGVGNTAMEWAVGFVDSLATGKDVVDDAVGFLTTFVMPFGGKQAERSLQALVDTGVLPQVKWGWKEGLTLGREDAPGSYSKNGEFQFPLHTVKTDFSQWIANVIFGKYATDSGQKYLGKDYENGTFWQNVFGFNKSKERKALSERATAVMKDLAKSGADVFEVYDTIRAIQDAEDTYGKNNVLRYSELTQDEKAKIILGYMTQKDDIESTEKKINAVLGVGLTVDDYLDIRNMYTIINKNEDLKSAGDKANQFVKELAASGYTSEQIAGIYEGMSFWQSIPANIDKFTEMTSSGLDSETAILVQEAFDALEPLPGKTQVTALQKVEAIANLGLSSEKENLALSQAMGKEQYAKYIASTDYGVNAKTWVDFQNALAAADAANGDESKRNGSYDKDEKRAALDSMDISNEAKAALWQTLDTMIGSDKKTTEWKAARNPYSSKVGADIVEKYMEAKQGWTVNAPEASEDVSLNSMVAPLAGGGTITSGFGYRNTGIPGASKNHQAVDIAAPTGTDVGATIAGVVTRVSSSGGYGNSVEITSTDADGNAIVTKYSHLDNFGVAVGDSIAQGQKIGEVGNTGTSSGSHLDFKLGVNGEWVDPTQYLDLAAAGIVDGTSYAVQEGTGGTAAVIYNAISGGGSSGGGSSKKSYISTGGTRVASVTTSKDGSTGSTGTSGGSSNGGGLSLPQASRPAVTGRSVDSPTYGTMGLTLPRANANRPTPTISTSVATTQRTGRTGGSLWDPDVLS